MHLIFKIEKKAGPTSLLVYDKPNKSKAYPVTGAVLVPAQVINTNTTVYYRLGNKLFGRLKLKRTLD